MPKGKKRLRDFLGKRLRTQIDELASKAGATFHEFQKGDNKQGREHCEAVEKNLDLLIPDAKKSELSRAKILVLRAVAPKRWLSMLRGRRPCARAARN